jgi:glycosyltransferase involved in cell wall biosynthesis
MSRLLVIVPDRISEILVKGEYQPNYYNPGDFFEDVHILMMNDDQPDPAAVQRTVGRARLTLHNYPDDLSLPAREPGFLRGRRLKRWAAGGVEIARRIRPDLIRCHGVDWNSFLAARIKAALGMPYVISVHTNPDQAPVRRIKGSDLTPDQRRHNRFYEYMERTAVQHADLVMPVYRSALPYLDRLGAKRVEVCYNILNNKFLRRKDEYRLKRPIELLYVSRLMDGKDPSNIIRAVASLPDVRLTLIGDGNLRPALESLVASLGLGERVMFRPAVPNDELCQLLPDYDLFVVHSDYWEISKSVLEALLTGLPVIINRRAGEPVAELQGDFVRLVENSAQAYRAAIEELINDDDARAALGRRAYEHANRLWSPAVTEAKVVGIYRRLLKENGHG